MTAARDKVGESRVGTREGGVFTKTNRRDPNGDERQHLDVCAFRDLYGMRAGEDVGIRAWCPL